MVKSSADRCHITWRNFFMCYCRQIVHTDANLMIMIGIRTGSETSGRRGMVRETALEETGKGYERERATESEIEKGTGTEIERETTEERTEVSVYKTLAALLCISCTVLI